MDREASDTPDSPSPDQGSTEAAIALGRSFRQSRLEMWLMLGAWVVFFGIVTLICRSLAFDPVVNEEGLIAEATLFGLPRWVMLGIAIPWLAANAFIIWFALGFMKDTPLPVAASSESQDEEPSPTES